MNKECVELLEKWKNFSKVHDAIRKAYSLGYKEGVKDGRYCEQMRTVEMLDINKMPNAK